MKPEDALEPQDAAKPQDDRIVRATEGDADELEQLIREATADLRRGLSIQPLWSRSLDVDDVLQVTYLEAFLRIRTLEQRTVTGFRTWLRRIAENNLRDAVRALGRDKRPDPRQRVTRGPEGESARTLFAAMVGECATAGGQASRAEEIERLRAAISQLPPAYRTVIEEVDLAERSVAEVARDLERSEGATHMLRSRARDRLRELLIR